MLRQFLELHLPDAVAGDLVFQEALIVDLRGWAEVDLPVLVQPVPQPLGQGILVGEDGLHCFGPR